MHETSPELIDHLSRIDTLWSVVHRAHEDDAGATQAQHQLLERYGTAIKRYLVASLKDQEAAEDVFQEFALKFVRGEFRNVDQSRGRFRYYVKTVLHNLICSHYRRSQRHTAADLEHCPEAEAPAADSDALFLANWREDLLSRTWRALAEQERPGSSSRYYSVLRHRVEHPAQSYAELAEGLARIQGTPLSAGAARVLVHRARERFGRLLIEAVSDSLGDPTLDSIEAELGELRLLDYCRDLLNSAR